MDASGPAVLEAIVAGVGGDVPHRPRRARPLPRASLSIRRRSLAVLPPRRRPRSRAPRRPRINSSTRSASAEARRAGSSSTSPTARGPNASIQDGRAHAGVTAALLARAGFTGPETVLEGAHGLYAGVRRRPRRRAARRLARQSSAASGRCPADLQAVSVRLDRAAVHGLRVPAAPARRDAARGHCVRPVPHRRRSGAETVGAARGQACVRRTATRASSACRISSPRSWSGTCGAGGLHRRRRPR